MSALLPRARGYIAFERGRTRPFRAAWRFLHALARWLARRPTGRHL